MSDTQEFSNAEKSAYVATKMGWTVEVSSVKEYDPLTGYQYRPDVWKAPGEDYAIHDEPPDLFADTPEGALAREQAIDFLIDKGWKFKAGRDTTGRYYLAYTVLREEIRERSRAEAIYAAFRALEEGK